MTSLACIHENDPRLNFNYISFQTRYQQNFKSYTYVSRVQLFNGTSSNYISPNRKCKIQDGGLQTSNTCNSTWTIDSNKIPSAIPMFLGSSYPKKLVSLLYDQTGRNRKWDIQDGGLHTSNTCNSACTIDSNDIPSAIPMLLGSSYPMEMVTYTNRGTDVDDVRNK